MHQIFDKMVHHNLFITLLQASNAKTLLAKQVLYPKKNV